MVTSREEATTITATQAQRRFGELIRRVFSGHEQVIVEKDGLPVMAIIPMGEYEVFTRERETRAKRLENAAREIGSEAQRRGYTEKQLMEELEQTKREVFEQMHGKPK